MKKYQIVEITENFNHAGTKATADIAEVADGMGYERLSIKMNTTKPGILGKIQRQIGFYFDWKSCKKGIEKDSLVLLQHPFHYPQLIREKVLRYLKAKKNVKYISVVHDVEELRAFRYNDYYKKEFEAMLDIADVIIVHNEIMKNFFVERGCPEEKLVVLEIFDYIQENSKTFLAAFEKKITVAGNLDVTKCKYIAELGNIGSVKVDLYGPNFSEAMKEFSNIEYKGSFPVDVIPQKLDSGFGLVWDGESIEGCVGLSGQYLKYNNPHKLSLYLSSGVPVVIWSKAAEAAFVKQKGVGICVDSLMELEEIFSSLTEEKYMDMVNNVEVVSKDLVRGSYANKAISESEKRMGIK